MEMMMSSFRRSAVAVFLFVGLFLLLARPSWAEVKAEVKASEGTVTIPTYLWEDDVNPKFWAMEGAAKLATTLSGAITYPYTMQDHLSRTKVDRTYKALFLENEYLKVTCLPELGGRLHSVFDKTLGKEMFHLNAAIKPSMIAMRGAWISGGIEWNFGPHGHTVNILSPVDALIGRSPDGSAFLEISNQEKIFRTRWTVRVTLHPGKAYLDEQIRIFNPTDAMHPYYFWNCTAFPCRQGTRFIYPMTLGTDHNGRQFFSWPIHEGKDLSWLKNYPKPSSIFAVQCEYDFFGAYDVDADQGIVQVADHHELSGKKAWTWGQSDFGRVCQDNLSDDGEAYIEVQSGPLPTQSDYGMLGPREEVSWQEWWYPVHGLGDGFEYATRDVAVQASRVGGKLELRLLATGKFPGATCRIEGETGLAGEKQINLSPEKVEVVTCPDAGEAPLRVIVEARDADESLAAFGVPLPIPKVSPPDPSKFAEKPDKELSAEQLYLKGRKYDRATSRKNARRYYEMALAKDPGHILSLRALAVLDIEAGLYQEAVPRLEKALERDSDDGLSWFFLGVIHLHTGNADKAVDCGFRAVRCPGTASLGHDLVGRAYMHHTWYREAIEAFSRAVRANGDDPRVKDHLALALYAAGELPAAMDHARRRLSEAPTDLIPRALLALRSESEMDRFAREVRAFVGEVEFEILETSLAFAELGLVDEAARLLSAVCVEGVSADGPGPLPLYYLAYFSGHFRCDETDERMAETYLKKAASISRDFVFASRAEAVPILKYALEKNPGDANAHLHLGNLLANLGRLEQAAQHWQKAAELRPSLSMAPRNLGLYYSIVKSDLPKAEGLYRKAIAARPGDQTLYRDLAGILIADGKRPEAIKLMETMPFETIRRAEIIIMLAGAYLDEQRYSDCLDLLESTPYFVNWEGQTITKVMFNKAHLARGQKRLQQKSFEGALHDFEAALTYPKNVGVGRSDKPEEASAQYWKGKALQALGRLEEARAAWNAGAAGAEGSGQQNKHRQLCKEALAATKQ